MMCTPAANCCAVAAPWARAHLAATQSSMTEAKRIVITGLNTAPWLAEGTARELHALVTAMAGSAPGSPGARVASWLRLNTDLSLVASAFGLDPLAHADPSAPVTLWNKTGTDSGVLVDVGVVKGPRAEARYAVIVNSENADGATHTRELRDAMRAWGINIAEITGL